MNSLEGNAGVAGASNDGRAAPEQSSGDVGTGAALDTPGETATASESTMIYLQDRHGSTEDIPGEKDLATEKDSADAPEPALQPPEQATDFTLPAWLAVLACFSSHVWSVGFGASWGVYQRLFIVEETFPGATNFQLSLVATVSFGVMIVSNVFVGPLSDRIEPRWMFLLGSIGMGCALLAASFATQVWHMYLTSTLYGFAGCFTIVPSTIVLPGWFSRRRALAMGISVSGTGLGAFMLAAISQACLSTGGWRLGLRVLAGMCAGWMIPAAIGLKRKGKPTPQKLTFLSVKYFRNPVFSLLFFSVMVLMLGFFSPQAYIPLMLTDGGYSAATGAAIVSVFSAVLAFGRILGGFMVDKLGELNMFVAACLFPMLATLCIWMPNPTNLGNVVAAAVVWAFWCGSPLVSLPILASNEFGLDELGSVLGTLYVGSTQAERARTFC